MNFGAPALRPPGQDRARRHAAPYGEQSGGEQDPVVPGVEPVWRPVRVPFVVAEHGDQDPPMARGVAKRRPVRGGLDARVERGIREPVRVTPGGDQVPAGAGEQAPAVRRAADDGYGRAGRDVVRRCDAPRVFIRVDAEPVGQFVGVPWHCESSAYRSVSISVSRMRYGARPSPARIRASWARSAASLESWCSGAVDESGQFAGLSRGVMHVVPASAVSIKCCSPPASLKANKMNFMEQANRDLKRIGDTLNWILKG